MNEGALNTSSEKAIGEEFNTAVGERADMNKMMVLLKTNLVKHDPQIANIEVIQGSERKGDIPQALANITNAKNILGYQPSHNLEKGFSAATDKLLNVTGIT